MLDVPLGVQLSDSSVIYYIFRCRQYDLLIPNKIHILGTYLDFHCSFSEYLHCLSDANNLHFVITAYKFSLTKNESVKLLSSLSFSQLQMALAQVHTDWCWFEIRFIEKTAKKDGLPGLLRLPVFKAVVSSNSPNLEI